MPRKLDFWRVYIGKDQNGLPRALPREDMSARLRARDWKTGLHPLDEAYGLLALVHPEQAGWVTFAKVEYDVELTVARNGDLAIVPLSEGDPAKLAQWVFLPSNVVGIVRQQSAPTVQQVTRFFQTEFQDMFAEFSIAPLYRGDLLETLGKIKRVTKFTLKLSSDATARLPRSEMTQAAKAIQQNSGSDYIEISAKVRGRKDRLTTHVKSMIQQIVKGNCLDNRSDILVNGFDEDGTPKNLSFANARFSFKIDAPKQRDGSPIRSPVFPRISEVFAENRDEIISAYHLEFGES